ncbi:MAG TPA: hypothetical protein VG897_13675 [Terriglobales bacterium]|nr:hypothetical protein [Terriglobales bacterium]
MTAYNASKFLPGVTPRMLQSAAGVKVLSTLALAALALNDTINFMNLQGDPVFGPNGPTICDVILGCDDIDTGAAVVLDVGDANLSGRYISGSTVGQAGGIARMNVAAGLGYQPFAAAYNNYTTLSNQLYAIVGKCTTAPNVFQAGTIRLLVDYTYDP